MANLQPRLAGVSARGLAESLGRSESINWRTHIIFALPALLSGFTYDLPRLGGAWQDWAIVSLAGYIATVLAIETLSLLIRKSTWKKPRPFLVVFILVLAGLFRGWVILLVGGQLQLVPQEDLAFRALGAPIFVVLVYVIANVLVSSRLDYQLIYERLVTEQVALERSRGTFNAEILRLRTELQLRIQELIAPSIWELGKLINDAKLSKDASLTIGALRGLNDSIIRPLSKTLAAQTQIPGVEDNLTAVQFGRVSIPKTVRLGETVPISLVVLATVVLTYSSQAAQADLIRGLFVSLGSLILVAGALLAFTRLTRKLELPTFLAALILAGYGGLIGLSTSLLLVFDSLGLTWVFVAQAMVFSTLNLLVHFSLSVFQRQRVGALGELLEVVEALKLVTSQLRQQAWLHQKMIASQLHGPMQALLHSSAFRLARLENPTPSELESVLIDVNRAVSEIGHFDYLEGSSVCQSLLELIEVWDGVCEIDIKLAEPALVALEQDPILARCFLEVVREAVTNAIKHGEAPRVWVEAELALDRLKLSIINDGRDSVVLAPGYGTAIIEELTLSSSLRTEAGKTVFRAEIPVASSFSSLVLD
jgi:hypothetical protein